jgi:hypothetical protein
MEDSRGINIAFSVSPYILTVSLIHPPAVWPGRLVLHVKAFFGGDKISHCHVPLSLYIYTCTAQTRHSPVIICQLILLQRTDFIEQPMEPHSRRNLSAAAAAAVLLLLVIVTAGTCTSYTCICTCITSRMTRCPLNRYSFG